MAPSKSRAKAPATLLLPLSAWLLLLILGSSHQAAALANRRDLLPGQTNVFAATHADVVSAPSASEDAKEGLRKAADAAEEVISDIAAGLAAARNEAFAAAAAVVDCGLGPVVCKTLDCPHYKVLDRYDSTELRRYDPATFTSTVLSLDDEGSIEKAAILGFRRLLKYNLGDNEDGKKVGMTAPVLYALDVDRKASRRHEVRWKDRFSVSFFVPFRYQDEPPSPSNPDVFLVDVPEVDVFVRSFDGYATGARITRVATDFLRDLHDDGHRVDCRTVYIAQYSPPFQPVFRYNEVWVLRHRRKPRTEDPADATAADATDATDAGADADIDVDPVEDDLSCGSWLESPAADDEELAAPAPAAT